MRIETTKQFVKMMRFRTSSFYHSNPILDISRQSRAYPSCTLKLERNFQRRNLSANQNVVPTNSSVVLFDSLTDKFKPLTPLHVLDDSNQQNESVTSKGLAWYTCGPTVYDSAHLGHARTYVLIDIIQRVILYHHNHQLSSSNIPTPSPIFIMNITDVDDKIIARAKERNISPVDLAKECEREFFDDMKALNIMYPTVVTRVTAHVNKSIIPYIKQIIDNGMAYIIPDSDSDDSNLGSVYFDVKAFEAASGSINKYGKLSSSSFGDDETFFQWDHNAKNKSMSTQKKKDSRDFALWKSRIKNDDEISWDSPWGKGRPGWHIECSAMIETISKEFHSTHDIHVHAGGIDLKFPHHTNEIAQAEAYHHSSGKNDKKKEWIPHWVHTGHLHINGLKMSKSLKNFITIKELLRNDDGDSSSIKPISLFESPADDFRLWCLGLSGSYRSPATYSRDRLHEAKVTRHKLIRILIDGEQWIQESKQQANSDCLSSSWKDEDFELLHVINESMYQCHKALMGSSHDQRSGFDLDGSSYLQALLSMSEAGCKYVGNHQAGSHPIQPMERLLTAMRQCLSIVGFSEKSTNAGLSQIITNGIDDAENKNLNKQVIDELVHFRSLIRMKALENKKRGDDNNYNKDHFPKEILALCDDLRKNSSSFGVEINDDNSSSGTNERGWRFKLSTRSNSVETNKGENDDNLSKSSPRITTNVVEGITESNFFSTGHYQGKFLEYDEDHVPTKNADGTNVSKTLHKKLLKKKEKYFRKRNENNE
jgi:cysteinyl-tRNA synthetase